MFRRPFKYLSDFLKKIVTSNFREIRNLMTVVFGLMKMSLYTKKRQLRRWALLLEYWLQGGDNYLRGRMFDSLSFDLLIARLPEPCFIRRVWLGLLSLWNSSSKPAIVPWLVSVSRLMWYSRFRAWTSVFPQDTASSRASWIKIYCSCTEKDSHHQWQMKSECKNKWSESVEALSCS